VSNSAASAVSCTSEGRTIVIFAFADPAEQSTAVTRLRTVEAYLATGPGWAAVAASAPVPTVEESVVQGVAARLGGTITQGTARD
jgi:hypothetical protein